MGLLQRIYGFFGDMFNGLINFLGKILLSMFNGLKELLLFLFRPILELLDALFYLIYKLGLLLFLLIQVILSVGKMAVSFIKGLFLTITGFSYDGSVQPLPSNIDQAVQHVLPAFQILQIDKIAYICLFVIWIFTAVSVLAIIGRFRGA